MKSSHIHSLLAVGVAALLGLTASIGFAETANPAAKPPAATDAGSAFEPALQTAQSDNLPRAAKTPSEDSAGSQAKRSAARESDALQFAQEHHPELAGLLVRLKQMDFEAYTRAIRDISQAREKLVRLADQDPERYELSLKIWQLDSQIRLLAARLVMSDDEPLRDKLRSLLEERLEVRRATLRLERKRALVRVQRAEAQLREIEGSSEELIEQDYNRLTRAIRESGPAGKSKPAGKTAAADDRRSNDVPKPNEARKSDDNRKSDRSAASGRRVEKPRASDK